MEERVFKKLEIINGDRTEKDNLDCEDRRESEKKQEIWH